jgi:hypothetical protein
MQNAFAQKLGECHKCTQDLRGKHQLVCAIFPAKISVPFFQQKFKKVFILNLNRMEKPRRSLEIAKICVINVLMT